MAQDTWPVQEAAEEEDQKTDPVLANVAPATSEDQGSVCASSDHEASHPEGHNNTDGAPEARPSMEASHTLLTKRSNWIFIDEEQGFGGRGPGASPGPWPWVLRVHLLLAAHW